MGFFIVLAFGASIDVTAWDKAMLTESISTSLLVVFLAFIILASIAWGKNKQYPFVKKFLAVAAILISGMFYAFAHDPNAYFILFADLILGCGIFFLSVRKNPLFFSYLAIVLGLLTIFVVQTINANSGKRYVIPIVHVIIDRVVPSEENLNFFIQKGMPFNPKVASMTSWSFHLETTGTDPAIKPFVAWVGKQGKQVTIQFLLSRPAYLLTAPLQDFQYLVNGENSEYRLTIAPPNFRITVLTDGMYPRTEWLPYLFGILLITNIFVLWKNKHHNTLWFFTLLLFITTYPLSVLVWQTDTIELQRHAFQIALQLRLASWIVILLLFERLIVSLRTHKII